jgi:hypothetical protein
MRLWTQKEVVNINKIYIQKEITNFLNIILRPNLIKHDFSETKTCLNLQVKAILLELIHKLAAVCGPVLLIGFNRTVFTWSSQKVAFFN